MNNPNPFVPKGSLLQQQGARRTQLKVAVSCVLAVSVIGLVAMLIQGCKRERPDADTNTSTTESTNAVPMDSTNNPPLSVSNPPVAMPPVASNSPVVPPPLAPSVAPVAPVAPAVPEVGGSEYVVAKGDSLAKIAKKAGVSLKALQAANPGVVPTKLKVGQKLVIPAGGKVAPEAGAKSTPAAASAAAANDAGAGSYVVKSGDSLAKIAKAHGTTVKAIEAANGLTTTKIKVGQKLKVPAKGESAAPAPVAPAPVPESAPALPPVSAPAPAK